MQLHSLHIKNFRVIKDAYLDFPEQVMGIIGNNGAGKSSIIEAISWALYGNQAARTGKNEIKSIFAQPDESCEVTLDFSINDDRYRVVRRLAGKTERPEVQLFRGDMSESVGVSETKKYVGELLGLDWKGFLTSFLARQQELNTLSDLQPARRRDHLAGMLGVDRIDRIIGHVKEDVRLNQAQAQLLERQLAEKEQVTREIAHLTEEKKTLIPEIETKSVLVKKAEEHVQVVSEQLKEIQETRSVWLQYISKIEAAEQTVRSLEKQIEEKNHEEQQLLEAEKEIARLEQELKPLPEIRKEIERLKVMQSRQELHRQLSNQVISRQKEIEQAEQKVRQIQTEIDTLQKAWQAYPQDLSEQLAHYQEELENARKHYTHVNAEKKGVEVQIAKLQSQMESISQFGPDSVCDRCLRPFGDDLPEIRRHLSNELDTLTAESKQLTQTIQEVRKQGEQLKQRIKQVEQDLKKRQELEYKLTASKNELATARQTIETSTRSLREMQKQLETIGPVDFDKEQYNQLLSRLKTLEMEEKQYNRLEGSLKRLPEVRKKQEQLQHQLVQAKEAVNALQNEQSKIAYADEQYQSIVEAFEASQKQLKTIQDEYAKLSAKLEVTINSLENKTEQLQKLEQAGKQLEEYRTNQFYGQKLAGLFSKFREYLISRIRPTLADFSSRLMSEMTDGKYSLVELDEKYNLRVMDTNQFYDVDRFSGGEKDLANLCLRLAISLALTESAGLSRSFIILDEVFGSQDAGRRELIIQALANLKQRFPQIILITHIEELRDRVEYLVEVKPTGLGWSEVVVDTNA